VPGYELVSYELADREAYLGLLREAWDDRTMSGAEFDWWFGRNPAGSLMSVARADGRVVGVAGHSLIRMELDGEEQVASFSVHATTLASARGQGIFAELERKHEREAAERGVAVVLAFASASTAPIFLGPLGWTEIGRLRVWARPLLAQARGPAAAAGFDDSRDRAAGWPNHVVRDATYLNWRFVDSPRGYRVVRTETGHAVVGRTRKRVEVAVLADLVAPDGEVRSLLRRAVAVSSGRVMIALPPAELRGAFLSLGFVPTTYTLHFMGKPLAGKLSTDSAAWRFTLGDTDFF
jgi:GNAT superfamily N-acetyltransferase